MKSLVILFIFVSFTDAWFWRKPTKPTWDSLYVTFGSFDRLPTTTDAAKDAGWTLTRNKTCDVNNYFAGNRYMLNGDIAVMLLFGANGKLAGIQMGAAKSIVGVKNNPWVLEDDMYVMTAYFTDPETICSMSQRTKAYGDRLLILDGDTNSTIVIPFKEEDLVGSKWVVGRCFPWMGQHYWYDISADMDCQDFYPVFIMYNGKRLNSFGWSTNGHLSSERFEHPTSERLGYFFEKKTLPECLHTAGPLSTQHVYMENPYYNFCYV